MAIITSALVNCNSQHATSSSGCANLGFKRAADDGETKFGQKMADCDRKDLYLDDGRGLLNFLL